MSTFLTVLAVAAIVMLAFPLSALGYWVGYSLGGWVDCKLTGRPSRAEVERRLMQLALDDAEMRRAFSKNFKP